MILLIIWWVGWGIYGNIYGGWSGSLDYLFRPFFLIIVGGMFILAWIITKLSNIINRIIKF